MAASEGIPKNKINSSLLLVKIISGGQTGADRAGLEAAKELGLETGGWAPQGFMTTKGRDETLKTEFGLEEFKTKSSLLSQSYVQRSIQNVISSDATLAFRYYESRGTDRTIGYCMTGRWIDPPDKVPGKITRPVMAISSAIDPETDERSRPDLWKEKAKLLHLFLIKNNVKVLNVCGHRQEEDDPGWQKRIKDFLLFALTYTDE